MMYDLHNWDFQGGIGYKVRSKPEAKRVNAIAACIKLQKAYQEPFIFLMTFNVRHKLGDELFRYLTDQAKELHSSSHIEMLKWYATRGAKDNTEHYRLKAVITLYIRRVAEMQSFDCYCFPPVYYEGVKEHLLHFAFQLNPQGTVLPCFSQQHLTDVIELPLIKVNGGIFHIPDLQHPGFSLENSGKLLQDLGLPPYNGQ